MARITPAAVAHDTACSDERPPKTMATRVLRGGCWSVVIGVSLVPAHRSAAVTCVPAAYSGAREPQDRRHPVRRHDGGGPGPPGPYTGGGRERAAGALVHVHRGRPGQLRAS